MSREGYFRWRWRTRHLDPEQMMVEMLLRYGRKAFRVMPTPEVPMNLRTRPAVELPEAER